VGAVRLISNNPRTVVESDVVNILKPTIDPGPAEERLWIRPDGVHRVKATTIKEMSMPKKFRRKGLMRRRSESTRPSMS
jgi:hypothetical protein